MKENQNGLEDRSCPLCEVKTKDILKHLRLRHSIENTEQLEREISRIEKETEKREKFASYVDELKGKVRKNEITFEEYRRLISKWNQKSSK